jgi:hypothetical protein
VSDFEATQVSLPTPWGRAVECSEINYRTQPINWTHSKMVGKDITKLPGSLKKNCWGGRAWEGFMFPVHLFLTGTVCRVKTLACCIFSPCELRTVWGRAERPKDTHKDGTKPETYGNRKLVLTSRLNALWPVLGGNNEWLNYFRI